MAWLGALGYGWGSSVLVKSIAFGVWELQEGCLALSMGLMKVPRLQSPVKEGPAHSYYLLDTTSMTSSGMINFSSKRTACFLFNNGYQRAGMSVLLEVRSTTVYYVVRTEIHHSISGGNCHSQASSFNLSSADRCGGLPIYVEDQDRFQPQSEPLSICVHAPLSAMNDAESLHRTGVKGGNVFTYMLFLPSLPEPRTFNKVRQPAW